ncbi:MAG: hypothetical protein HUU20_21685 [Pirellulales bacterium]|nr:hypothetical protein [Pirellulales bacterium]
MRLTLRTLLAYMDDILEPDDAQDIAKKIQDSDFASGLLQRIRDVTRRLRLAAPGVTDRGAGLDPNTVAEYLDNTLPADRVPDFEKVCLESDIHLAELASCHQILTLVLGEPAEVDPESRLRMYHVPTAAAASPQPDAQPLAQDAVSGNGQAGEPVAGPSREPGVPEYLRESRPRRLWPVTLMALAGVVVVLGLFAAGQFRPGTPLGNLLARKSAPSDMPAPALPAGPMPESGETAGKSPLRPAEEPKTPGTGAAGSPVPSQPPVVPIPPGAKIERPSALPDAQATSVLSAPPAVPEPIPNAPLPKDAPVEPKETTDADRMPSPPMPGPSQPSAPTVPVPSAGGAETPPAPAPAEPSRIVQPGAVTAPDASPAAAIPETAPEPAPVPGLPVGNHVSATEILVRLDREAHWQRVPTQAVLSERDEILSLPTYRPSLSLKGGVAVEAFDGTRVGLLTFDPNGIPGVDVRYGRLVIKPGEQKDARVWLRFGQRAGLVGFGDVDSVLMVEAGRPGTNNADPEAQPAPLVADLYATSGKVLWQEGGNGEPIALAAPMRLRLDENPLQPVAAQEIPAWSSPDAVSMLDQRTSAIVERAISHERMVNLALHELAVDRRREVRWLAMRCLGHLGDFGLIAGALNDPEQKTVWQDHIDELRAALARGPESAARVRAAMEHLFAGDPGTTLYQLLWKYRKPEISKEEAARLINLLEHEVLAVRVLSFWNLREATGLMLFYRPEYPAAKRMPAVQKWRERMGVSPNAGVLIPPGADGTIGRPNPLLKQAGV